MNTPPRRKTLAIEIGKVLIGHGHPIAIQSMTNTPTADILKTVRQCAELIKAGSELVRITIKDEAAARAIEEIIPILRDKGYSTPIIGDFHFNGHQLLRKFPGVAQKLDKYRINPGNVGNPQTFDDNFSAMIKTAIEYDKPVRIGVNSGSLDQNLLTQLQQVNSKKKNPKSFRELIQDGMVQSALRSAQAARRLGLQKNKIVLSVKMSDLQDTVKVYEQLAAKCDYALHLGLTESGSQLTGIVSSTAAMAILLQQGIGDTIRVSLTPQHHLPRTTEVEVCKELLQALSLRHFSPRVISCPGCGRTKNKYYETLSQQVKNYVNKNCATWKTRYPGVERLNIAIMGCVVNGPGESKSADLGISLPGDAEKPQAVVFADGRKLAVLHGAHIKNHFLKIIENYLHHRYSQIGKK